MVSNAYNPHLRLLFAFINMVLVASRAFPGDFESLEESSLTISVLAIWIYLLWFFLGWRYTGPFVIMIVEIIRRDVACLCLIFAVILGGFTSAFLILGDAEGLRGAMSHLKSCSAAVFGETELLTFDGNVKNFGKAFNDVKETISIILAFIFLFLIGIILLSELALQFLIMISTDVAIAYLMSYFDPIQIYLLLKWEIHMQTCLKQLKQPGQWKWQE